MRKHYLLALAAASLCVRPPSATTNLVKMAIRLTSNGTSNS